MAAAKGSHASSRRTLDRAPREPHPLAGNRLTGGDAIVQVLADEGVDTIFTLVGDHLNEVLVAAAQAGLRIVDMRHESAVAHAADAWARIHRRPAMSLVTGGDFAMNGINYSDDGDCTPPDFGGDAYSATTIGGDFRIDGAADVSYASFNLLELAGSFENFSRFPEFFSWEAGGVLLTAAGSGPALRTFEVAGADRGGAGQADG